MSRFFEDPADLGHVAAPQLFEPPELPTLKRNPDAVAMELGRNLRPAERAALIDEDDFMRAVAQGCTMTAICKGLGLSWLHLNAWVDEGRRGRFNEAKRLAAVMIEERAEEVLLTAPPTIAELARARAVSALLQARAKVHDPATYGDRTQVAVTHDVLGELKARIHGTGSLLPIASSDRAGETIPL